jgi:hypothetical protein
MFFWRIGERPILQKPPAAAYVATIINTTY